VYGGRDSRVTRVLITGQALSPDPRSQSWILPTSSDPPVAALEYELPGLDVPPTEFCSASAFSVVLV